MNRVIAILTSLCLCIGCAERMENSGSVSVVSARLEVPEPAVPDRVGGITVADNVTRTYSDGCRPDTVDETIAEAVFYIFDEAGGFVSKTSFPVAENYRLHFPGNGDYSVYVLCNMARFVDMPDAPALTEIESLSIPHRERYDRLPLAGKTRATVTGDTPTINIVLYRINSAIRIENRSAGRVELVGATVSGLPDRGNIFATGTEASGVAYSESADAEVDADGNAVVYSFFVPKKQMSDVKIEAEALVKGDACVADSRTETVLAPLTFVDRLEAGEVATALMGYADDGLMIGSPDNWGNVGRYELPGGVRLQVVGGGFFAHKNAKALRAYSGGSVFTFTVSAADGVASLRIAEGSSSDWVSIGDGTITVAPNTSAAGRECRIAVTVGGNNVGMFYVTQGRSIAFTGTDGTVVENGRVAVIGGRGTVAGVRFDISSEELDGMEIVPVGNGERGITVSVDRKARTVAASFIAKIDASRMSAEGVSVPVEFRDIHGTVRACLTFWQRPATIVFDPSEYGTLPPKGGTVSVSVESEGDARWAVGSIVAGDGDASASWITKTSPADSASSGGSFVLRVEPNDGSALRTAYIRVESRNTVSRPYAITQKTSYGIKSISADSSWDGTVNTLKAYSKGRTYKFTIEIDKALPEDMELSVDCDPDVSGSGGIKSGAVTRLFGNMYNFDLAVPDSDNADKEVSHGIAVMADGKPIYRFTVTQAFKPSFVEVNKVVWGGVKNRPELKTATYHASVWDVRDFSSDNEKLTVTKISATEIEVAYAGTLKYDDAVLKAAVTMNLNGGNSVTYTTEQRPVVIDIDYEDLVNLGADATGGEFTLTVNTKADTLTPPWRVVSVSDSWFTVAPAAGGPETNASGATVTVAIGANTGGRRTGYFTLESLNTTSQKFYVGQRDPFATVTIGGLQWMQYNLANPRQAPGGATFATALPSECTGIRLASHGKFYQWGYNVAWSTVGAVATGAIPAGSVWHPAALNGVTSWSDSPCPDGFRLPTNAEVQKLLNACTWTCKFGPGSSTDYAYVVLTSKTNSNLQLEFVANGVLWCNELGTLGLTGTEGSFWASNGGNGFAGTAIFGAHRFDIGTYTNYLGRSVRCVR